VIEVSIATPYGTVSPSIQTVYKGTPYASIKCFSLSPVTWLSPRKDKIPKKRITNNELTFVFLKNKHTGVYTCLGTSESGAFEAKSELLVGSK